MSARQGFPISFTVNDPVRLKTDLDRLGSWLSAYTASLTGPPQQTQVAPRLQKLSLNSQRAAFGFITPVTLVKSTDVLPIALPPPDPRNAGLVLYISRTSTAGTITLAAPRCKVNGFDSVELSNEIAATPIMFDGENYLAPPGAVWGV